MKIVEAVATGSHSIIPPGPEAPAAVTMLNSTSADSCASVELAVADLGPHCALVSVSGELDLAATGPLTRALAWQIQTGRYFVRLDISAVTFLDCSCLGVIVAAHRRLLSARGALILTGVSARIARMLELTRLDTLLTVSAVTDEVDQHAAIRVDTDDGTPPPSRCQMVVSVSHCRLRIRQA